jgi:hypothetical protein
MWPFKKRKIILDCNFDYKQILQDNKVTVDYDRDARCYGMTWKHGCISDFGSANLETSQRSAALFVKLWLLGIEAGLAIQLMRGYQMRLQLTGKDIT